MKTFFKSLKRQGGFTLVELMVVVAIIGLLSAVAIPNFRKYQAKAKMSEAKLQLSSVYTAETAFYSDYNIYHTCLLYMGFDPRRERVNRYYLIGFNVDPAIDGVAYTSATNSGIDTVACARTLANGADVTFFVAGKGVGAGVVTTDTFLPTTAIGVQSNQTTMTFTAGAAGIIDGDNVTATTSSRLTINEAKAFRIITNGY